LKSIAEIGRRERELVVLKFVTSETCQDANVFTTNSDRQLLYVSLGSQPVKLGMSICRLFDIRQQTFAADSRPSEQMKPLEHRSQNQN
jgi:hypothetical protein